MAKTSLDFLPLFFKKNDIQGDGKLSFYEFQIAFTQHLTNQYQNDSEKSWVKQLSRTMNNFILSNNYSVKEMVGKIKLGVGAEISYNDFKLFLLKLQVDLDDFEFYKLCHFIDSNGSG